MTPALPRVLIVDDERPARAKLALFVARDRRLQPVGEASGGLEALAAVEALRPDVVLLDVQMPDLDGFEVLDALPPERPFAVVFVTAHDAHALRAFDAHAVDYLLKPFDELRFARAIDKALTQLAGRERGAASAAPPAAPRERIALKTDEGWVSVAAADIRHCAAADKHVLVSTATARLLVRSSLSSLVDRLDPSHFVRTHRSEVVNLSAVERIDPLSHGDAMLSLVGGATVILSRTYRRQVLERLGWPGPRPR